MCALKTLALSDADVDDDECVALVATIERNTTLRRLDLSRNRIGAMEGANQLNPLLRTGGEALAAQLPSNVTLTALDLSWNSLRAESAIALARALGENDGTNALAIWGGGELVARVPLFLCVARRRRRRRRERTASESRETEHKEVWPARIRAPASPRADRGATRRSLVLSCVS